MTKNSEKELCKHELAICRKCSYEEGYAQGFKDGQEIIIDDVKKIWAFANSVSNGTEYMDERISSLKAGG